MNSILKTLCLISSISLVTACAGAKFPETGTASPYDGMWSAQLPADSKTCGLIVSNFEIRYGTVIGTVSENGRKIADIWGDVSPEGHLDGLIGQMGITGATASVTFSKTSGTGTWKNKFCKGTVKASKIG